MMAEIGYCGDNCECCPRYIATKSGDRGKLKAVAVLWKKVGLTDTIAPAKEMVCHGCALLETCHYNDIRLCARNRDIGNCGQCSEYACDKIKAVFQKTASYARQCEKNCGASDYERLNDAFFQKKRRLDAIHLSCSSDVKKGR